MPWKDKPMSRVNSTVLSPDGIMIERHWQELAGRRRAYSWLIGIGLLIAVSGSLWFANDSNAGKFFDRIPYFFDFAGDLVPRDGWEVWRALFDLPSPYADGSLKFDYPEGRVYLFGTFYMPEYFYKVEYRNHCYFDWCILRVSALFSRGPKSGQKQIDPVRRTPVYGNSSRVSRDRHRRIFCSDPVVGSDPGHVCCRYSYDRRVREAVLRGC
jgi:hypothetical protein